MVKLRCYEMYQKEVVLFKALWKEHPTLYKTLWWNVMQSYCELLLFPCGHQTKGLFPQTSSSFLVSAGTGVGCVLSSPFSCFISLCGWNLRWVTGSDFTLWIEMRDYSAKDRTICIRGCGLSQLWLLVWDVKSRDGTKGRRSKMTELRWGWEVRMRILIECLT